MTDAELLELNKRQFEEQQKTVARLLPNQPPVASQLGRIEAALGRIEQKYTDLLGAVATDHAERLEQFDKLLQSHAALENRFEDSQRWLTKVLDALSAQQKGGHDGVCNELARLAEIMQRNHEQRKDELAAAYDLGKLEAGPYKPKRRRPARKAGR